MIERDSLPGERRPVNYAAWSFAIAFLTMGGALVTQWSAANEARAIAVQRDLVQNETIAKLSATAAALEERLRAIETNRAIEQRIGDLTVAVARVETEVSALRRDVRGRR